MGCDHCRWAISSELQDVVAVGGVDVDLDSERVAVHGEGLDDAALRAAITVAVYEAA